MQKMYLLILPLLGLGATTSPPARAEVVYQAQAESPERWADRLQSIIAEQQRRHVRESWGELDFQCFTWLDYENFRREATASAIAQSVKNDAEFRAVVAGLRPLPARERMALLDRCRKPLRPTWRQIGKISREGQTEAGQQAERMIAEAIVNLVERCIRTKTVR